MVKSVKLLSSVNFGQILGKSTIEVDAGTWIVCAAVTPILRW